ncbi:MAG TPA: Holliday junction branch migration protein RuvA [Geminicoccaceae bacterium]|nr:Holliday junction branch migration protein RuvA [Geminicoccus sp.]HMU50388.1 Holliday junction branch migration protein RuvA [Geminicoccaceae bacterium]
MIAYLRGRVIAMHEDAVVLDVGGVGYLVHCATRTLAGLGSGEAVELHVETQVREDAITLFGFLDPAECRWFRLLQGIQGVGARTALAVLGVLTPDRLVTAIAAQDRTALTRASGVGAKLAARIVAELKERIGALPTPAGRPAVPVAAVPAAGPAEDAVSALVNLGYGRAEAFAAVARCRARLGEGAAVGELVREGLKELSA